MAFVLGDRPVRPLTADEFVRMVEAGILDESERVELLHGVLTRMSPKSAAHERVIARLVRWLVKGTDGREVLIEAPLVVPDRTSLPEPDVMVIERDDDVVEHPTTALLVVEVAHSSLKIDTTVKPSLYAATGVPEYWVVDVSAKQVTVYTNPSPDGYTSTAVLGPAERARPIAVDVEALDLAQLFRGL